MFVKIIGRESGFYQILFHLLRLVAATLSTVINFRDYLEERATIHALENSSTFVSEKKKTYLVRAAFDAILGT